MHSLRLFCPKICVLFLSIIGSFVSVANGQVFAPNVQVDDDEPFIQYHPSIAAGFNGDLYVLFGDTRDGGQMYFGRSLDGGRIWNRPNIRVSDTCIREARTGTSLAVDDAGVIYACWSDDRDDGIGGRGIYSSVSRDGGATWSSNVRVSDSTAGGKYLGSMVIAPDQSICVVWDDYRHGLDIYFARSTDGGETWTDPNIRVDDGSVGQQDLPCICADQWGTLYVGYRSRPNSEEPFHVYLVRSTDYGETWSAPAFRVDDGRYADHDDISLTVSPTGLYAVWWMCGAGMDNIVFSKSTDGGETWSRPVVQVDHIGAGLWSMEPDLGIGEDGTLYATWTRWDVYGDAQTDVFFGQSTDDGQTWTNPSVQVSDVWWDAQEDPKLTIDSDQNVCITWVDARERTPVDPVGVYFTRTVPVLAYVETDNDTVAGGESLGVTIWLVNTTSFAQTADIWTGMELHGGGAFYKVDPMYGPQTFAVAPYDSFPVCVDHEIPPDMPLGEYEYWVKVDDDLPYYDPPYRFETDPDRYYFFKDTFTFTIVEGRERAGVGLKGRWMVDSL